MDSINCRANGSSTEEVLGHATVQYIYAAFLVVSCLLCFVGNTLNFVVLRKLTDISEPRKVVFYFLSMSDLCTGIGWVPSIPAVSSEVMAIWSWILRILYLPYSHKSWYIHHPHSPRHLRLLHRRRSPVQVRVHDHQIQGHCSVHLRYR